MTAVKALDFDAAPGDVCAVRDLLDVAGGVASELDYLRQKLDEIGCIGSGWEGKAALAFAGRVGELPRYLRDAGQSAAQARRALNRWLEQLDRLKAQAGHFDEQAATARDALRCAKQLVEAARAQLQAAPPEAYAEATQELVRARQAAEAARRHLEGIVKSAADLLDEHQSLADQVASQLRKAAELAPPEPGFFESIGKALDDLKEFVESLPERAWKFVQEHAELIKALASVLADIATILAFVALLAPGGAIAGVILALSVTALAVTAVADVAGAEVSPLTYASNLPLGGLGLKAFGKLAKYGVPMVPRGLQPWVKKGVDTGVGAGGSLHEGDLPFGNWFPSSPGELALGAVSPVGLALWNATHDGMAKDRARKARAQEAEWLR